MPIGTIESGLHLWTRLQTRFYTLLVGSQFKEFGKGSRISAPLRCYGLNEMILGDGVTIERDCWIQTIPGGNGEGAAKLVIGSHSGIGMGATISAAHKIVIGENVLLARNVYISDHSHAFEKRDLPIMQQGIDRIAPVIIGRNTWLGQNVVVLPGVTIGEHCVIGANSVVNSSIPPFSVAVGSPARVVRQLNKQSDEWETVQNEPK